ncbi:hypothetical protein [Nostoc favosum]|uniref:Uncharacterized protein n=2 Tax=Bacteria TaxID=2 RepID=A0ABS8IIX1_9NOSO|nr:hypothetical protein [Phyllobacterium sp.]MCC5604152.1 hypothetical protein [Nostoc favosum CHAB5714]
MYLEEFADRPRISSRMPIAGVDYAHGTPLDSFILPDTQISWQDFHELARDTIKNAKSQQELKLAIMLSNAIANRMGNPWAGDTSRIRRQAQARMALLERTKSKHRDVIVAMLRAGYEINVIADVTGLHASSIRRWRRQVAAYNSRFH